MAAYAMLERVRLDHLGLQHVPLIRMSELVRDLLARSVKMGSNVGHYIISHENSERCVGTANEKCMACRPVTDHHIYNGVLLRTLLIKKIGFSNKIKYFRP